MTDPKGVEKNGMGTGKDQVNIKTSLVTPTEDYKGRRWPSMQSESEGREI